MTSSRTTLSRVTHSLDRIIASPRESKRPLLEYGEHGLTVWPFEGQWRTLWCHRPKCRRAIPDFYSCPAEPNVVPSPSEVQEIPLEEVTQKVPESSGKRPAETSSG
ncbi:hypothetical protein GW17_00027899 [Ensete ventricosum]|nr:hypothetical protein GW17_00027899 [Ensete ventricosum]